MTKNYNRMDSTEVRNIVKKHILEGIEGLDDNTTLSGALQHFKHQLEVNSKCKEFGFVVNQNVMLYTLQGVYAGFEWTNQGLENFIDSLNIDTHCKKFDCDKYWNIYASLIYTNYKQLLNKSEKQLQQILNS